VSTREVFTMNLQRCTAALVGGLLLLPVGILVSLGVAGLLSALGDRDGAVWIGRLAAVVGVVWVVDLVALVATIALGNLGCCRGPENSCKSE
jgi:hypothetical protein